MPFIATFFGIIVTINFFDHAPPHIHAAHGGLKALFDIRTGRVIAGGLARRETRYVLQWIDQHRDELMQNWDLAVQGKPTFKIEGLSDD